MKEELKRLLNKYKDGELTAEERRRLAQLVSSEEGRRQALASGSPEAIFLAHEEPKPKLWEEFWPPLEQRLEKQVQRQPVSFLWKPALAAAALIVLVALVAIPFLSTPQTTEQKASDQQAVQKRIFALKHRLPSEVLPGLHQFMSNDAELHVSQVNRELEITDRPENLERITRALQMLDLPPAELQLRLQLYYPAGDEPEDALMAEVRREVGRLGDADLSGYLLKDETVLTPAAGRRYSATLQDRYVINCFAELKPDGTGVTLRDISIYDKQTQEIVRKSGLVFTKGEILVIRTELKDDSGRLLVVAIDIAPNDNE